MNSFRNIVQYASLFEGFNDILGVSVQDTEYKPFVVCLRHKVRGDACMGVLCLWALNFGGDVGGKSSVRGLVPASSGVRIRQCVHLYVLSLIINTDRKVCNPICC